MTYPQTDILVEHGVQIQIKENGKLIWVNIDGVCKMRIINIDNKEIQIEDNRPCSEEQPKKQLEIKWEKTMERNENG